MSVYANAADVLPSELLKAVQKHWRGLLYIPPVNYKSKADKNFVQNMVAFFAPRVSLESHLCFGAEAVAAVSIAVASTAEIFSSFIGKKSPSKK